MNRQDRHWLYLNALRDIHRLLLEAPLDLLRYLTKDGAYSILQRHIHGTPMSYFDLDLDYRRICQGLHRASEEYPENAYAKACQGRALVGLGHYEAAIQEYQVAARLAPESTLINVLCGEAHYYLAGREFVDSLDCYMTAVCYLSDALMIDPKSSRAYICRAHCQAHVLSLCGYPQNSERFKLYYRKIIDDLLQAKRYTPIKSMVSIDLIEKAISAILGISLAQILLNS